MSAEQLVEKTRNLLLDAIKTDLPAALADIRDDREDPIVTTEPPRSFFIYDGAHTYQCPAIFCVVDSADFPEESFGPNHINALVTVYVSAVIEEREARLLTIKSERYQAALFRVLHRRHLQDTIKNVKIYARVTRAEFSPLYTKERENAGVFRKEVSLQLEVKHFENPN